MIEPPPMKPVKQREPVESGKGSIPPSDLARMDVMSREELLGLIKRVAGAIWGYALKDDTEKAEAARLKLYNLGMSSEEVHKVVPALDKWFDRTQGKAPQAVEMTVKKSPVERLSDEEFIHYLALLPNPVVIPPMPGKDES